MPTSEGAQAPAYLADGSGLYLRIAPGTRRLWVYRYVALLGAHNDPEPRLLAYDAPLGTYPRLSIAAVRKLAKDTRARLARDHDAPGAAPSLLPVSEKDLRAIGAPAIEGPALRLWAALQPRPHERRRYLKE